jgi:hypothetical protein
MLVRDDAEVMTHDEEADRHWAAVSNLTQLAAGHRTARRLSVGRRARVRVGLAFVRAGLAMAPLHVDDLHPRLGRAS